jgi:hypothetical protein
MSDRTQSSDSASPPEAPTQVWESASAFREIFLAPFPPEDAEASGRLAGTCTTPKLYDHPPVRSVSSPTALRPPG